ncbi:hypothetical protein HK102_004728 [Quaeritorhiza haematococci]|nr:hypothetical protein HK102_004728 [Quaeritorhiza haematococci]
MASTTTAATTNIPPKHANLPPLYPPFRYAMVQEDLFRGAYPKERNYRFLRRLHLRSILSLTPNPPNPSLLAFCSSHGIQSIHIRVDKPKDNVPLTFAKVASILPVLINTDNLPMYVHCMDGTVVTGMVICCLRKLQCWSSASAMIEYARALRDGVIGSEESEFVEKFQAEIEVPPAIPPWLWGGQITFKKHPTLKLRLPPQPQLSLQQQQQQQQLQQQQQQPGQPPTLNMLLPASRSSASPRGSVVDLPKSANTPPTPLQDLASQQSQLSYSLPSLLTSISFTNPTQLVSTAVNPSSSSTSSSAAPGTPTIGSPSLSPSPKLPPPQDRTTEDLRRRATIGAANAAAAAAAAIALSQIESQVTISRRGSGSSSSTTTGEVSSFVEYGISQQHTDGTVQQQQQQQQQQMVYAAEMVDEEVDEEDEGMSLTLKALALELSGSFSTIGR